MPIPPAFSTLKLVSDTHSLASHPLGPHRPPGLTPCPAPIRSPPTHTPAKTCPAHPAAGPFADPTLLTETLSYDADTDTLPPLSPTVSTALRLPPDPVPALHRTRVSPDHSLASAPDPPTRTPTVHTLPSAVVPDTITTPQPPSARPSRLLAAPAPCPAPPASKLIPALTLPPTTPAVKLTPMLAPPHRPSKQLIDVSDIHPLRSHADPPIRPRPDTSQPPTPAPATTTDALSPASPGPLLLTDSPLTTDLSVLHPAVVELTATPAVAKST